MYFKTFSDLYNSIHEVADYQVPYHSMCPGGHVTAAVNAVMVQSSFPDTIVI
jgi:hypothetical protein